LDPAGISPDTRGKRR